MHFTRIIETFNVMHFKTMFRYFHLDILKNIDIEISVFFIISVSFFMVIPR